MTIELLETLRLAAKLLATVAFTSSNEAVRTSPHDEPEIRRTSATLSTVGRLGAVVNGRGGADVVLGENVATVAAVLGCALEVLIAASVGAVLDASVVIIAKVVGASVEVVLGASVKAVVDASIDAVLVGASTVSRQTQHLFCEPAL